MHHDDREMSALGPVTDRPVSIPIPLRQRRSVGCFTYPRHGPVARVEGKVPGTAHVPAISEARCPLVRERQSHGDAVGRCPGDQPAIRQAILAREVAAAQNARAVARHGIGCRLTCDATPIGGCRIRERDHFPTARGSGAALNRQSKALAVPPGRQFSHSIVAFREGRIPWPPRQSTRFASRGGRKDAGVPDAQAETMAAEPVFTLVGARSPKYLTAEERTRFLAATRA